MIKYCNKKIQRQTKKKSDGSERLITGYKNSRKARPNPKEKL
jgi:hypothetical protein